MNKKPLLPTILCLLLTVTVALVGCAGVANVQPGVLEGKVMIGPRPAEEIGKPYPAEIYQPRKVMVYDADHKELLKQVDLDSGGYYRVELPPGTYSIDINYYQNDSSENAPRKLKIDSGIHIMFDIDFDMATPN